MERSRVESVSFLVLFALVSTALFYVFAPFLQLLALAAMLAVLFHAPFEELATLFRGYRSIAAVIIVVVVLIFFIVPLFFLGWQIFQEAQGLYTTTQGSGADYAQTIQNAIENPIQRIFPNFAFDVNAYVENIVGFVSANLGGLVSGTFYLLLETFLMLLAFFFFLRDGEQLLVAVHSISPFQEVHTHEILNNMHRTIESVMTGTLVIALIRWILVGIGFYLFGIPNAVLWGSIGGIVGAIPGLGTPFVFIPAVAFFYFQGNIVAAIGLAVFGLIVMGYVDNILTPYFFGKGLPVSPIFILFSILGGIIFFGPFGFILGPLVLSVFLSVIHMYKVLVGTEQGAH